MDTKLIPLCVMMLLSLAACSGRHGETTAGLAPAGLQSAPDSVGEILLKSASFSLSLLDHGQLGLDPAALRLEESPAADGSILLQLNSCQSEPLHGICLRLAYDASALQPGPVELGAVLQQMPGTLMELSGSSRPGLLDYGAVQAGFANQAGSQGSGELLSIRFRPASKAPRRLISKAPASAAARAQMHFSTGNPSTFSWTYTCPGDYDQNGEVNVADLTPLGQNYGTGGGFEYATDLYQIDGDGNGELNISDLTTIGQNYGASVAGYAIYRSTSPDTEYPSSNTAASLAELIHETTAEDEAPRAPGFRRRYYFSTDEPVGVKDVFWIRPLDQSGQPGTPSNRSDEPIGNGQNAAPLAFLKADVLDAEVPFSVNFNMSDSYDPEGADLQYQVFLSHNADSLATGFGANAQASIQIVEPGIYRAYALVYDGAGSSNSQYIYISASLGGNHEPLAQGSMPQALVVDAPYTFEVDMSASTDADGDSLRYFVDISTPYDPDGYLYNGSVDIDNGSDPIAKVTLLQPAYYDISVWVLDQHGLKGTSLLGHIVLTKNGNVAPHLWITPKVKSGTAPFEAAFEFNAGINYDEDGEIVKYEFDPLGDGNWNEFNWEDNDYIFVYEKGGEYRPRVRALDNGGLWGYNTAVNTVEVSGNPGAPPVVNLTASDTSGILQLNTDLSASTSFDPDGVILGYEFDFDDGIGWRNYGLTSLVNRSFGIGTHNVKVRVTDNQGYRVEDSVTLNVIFFNP